MKKNIIVMLLLALFAFAANSQAAIDTTDIEAIVTDCTAWITYGVTAFLTLVGAGLTIVGASWVYRKVKRGLNAA